MTKPPAQARNAQTLAVFKSSALFDALDPASLQQLLGMARTIRLDRGQVCQTRDSRVDGVVIVANGFLRISLSNTEGKRPVVRHLGPGNTWRFQDRSATPSSFW